MEIRYLGRAWLLAVLVSLNPANADQQVVFAIDSTLTVDELRATRSSVGDILQQADIKILAGIIVFDRVVSHIVPLQENTETFRGRLDSLMAALIVDRMAEQQSGTSHPAIGIERSIAELQTHGGDASRFVVLLSNASRLDATIEEVDRRLQWLSVILLPELEAMDSALLLVTSHGSTENRMVSAVLGFNRNRHLTFSESTRIAENIWPPISSAQQQTETHATESGRTEAVLSGAQTDLRAATGNTLTEYESISDQSAVVESSVSAQPSQFGSEATQGASHSAETPSVAEPSSVATRPVETDVRRDSGVANTPNHVLAPNRPLTFISAHLPGILLISLFVLIGLFAGAVIRKLSRKQEALRSTSPSTINTAEDYLPLDMTRQRHFTREIQHNENRRATSSASGLGGKSIKEPESEADPQGEADTVVRTRRR